MERFGRNALSSGLDEFYQFCLQSTFGSDLLEKKHDL